MTIAALCEAAATFASRGTNSARSMAQPIGRKAARRIEASICDLHRCGCSRRRSTREPPQHQLDLLAEELRYLLHTAHECCISVDLTQHRLQSRRVYAGLNSLTHPVTGSEIGSVGFASRPARRHDCPLCSTLPFPPAFFRCARSPSPGTASARSHPIDRAVRLLQLVGFHRLENAHHFPLEQDQAALASV